MSQKPPSNDLSSIRVGDREAAYAHFWRGLDEFDPGAAGRSASQATADVSWQRRDFLKCMGASLALAGSGGCTRAPLEQIVPYRSGPAESTYGTPVYFATTVSRDGYGVGVLVETNMGRPTKIEGNPLHPASLGATDIFAQAAVLDLWDPDRSRHVLRHRSIASWDRFTAELQKRLRAAPDGRGLFILTETITSPTLHRQLRAILARYPGARWHQYQPLNRDHVYAGSRVAYGEALEPVYDFGAASVVVALDADFVGTLPGCVRYAHDFADTRRAGNPARMNRLYVAEGTPSLAGALADHKRVVRSSDIGVLTERLARRILGPQPGVAAPESDAWLDAAVSDLASRPGASLVIAGDRQPARVHALVHRINAALGNVGATFELRAPVAFDPSSQLGSLRALVDAMNADEASTLLILGGNPVYDAPADFDFGAALLRVPWKAHVSLYDDETSFRCDWQLPAAHALEAWGDVSAYDGTISIQQPCIAPLYDGKSASEILSAILEGTPRAAYDVVRDHWRGQRGLDFEAFWREALSRGRIEASPAASRPQNLRARESADSAAQVAPLVPPRTELVFAADPTLGDGRYANNAWLQELPKPLTTLTWDNVALVSPAFAARLSIESEDVVRLTCGSRQLDAPAWIMPGHADDSVTLHLGHGRTRAGGVGNGVGVDAYSLRDSAQPWIAGVTVERTGARHPLAAAQTHHRMEGRDLVRTLTRDDAARCLASACRPAHGEDPKDSLYPGFAYDGYRWGMSIDLSSCIGCGVCTIACQAENNIPVVGKDEVRRGREMHWIRVDRYFAGSRERPRTFFQPVPCMQCEHAPCEEVCPVEASIHDAEGLNVQVYNRCVGTRFCSNNCPYKVRRFNFLSYTRDLPILAAQRNPEVTVRMRGVMEKCSYCIQRIANARVNADREDRRIADGEVVTACQAACPTRAIVFGDLNDPASEVNARKSSPLDYTLLAELNTRPRTTYLPKISNPASSVDPT